MGQLSEVAQRVCGGLPVVPLDSGLRRKDGLVGVWSGVRGNWGALKQPPRFLCGDEAVELDSVVRHYSNSSAAFTSTLVMNDLFPALYKEQALVDLVARSAVESAKDPCAAARMNQRSSRLGGRPHTLLASADPFLARATIAS